MKYFSGTISKRLVAALLVVTLIVPTTLFVLPKKAEAGFSDCLIKYGFGFGIAEGEKSLASIVIPMINMPAQTDGLQTGSSVGDFWKDCVEHGIAMALGRLMLTEMTQSVVEWINGGFDGSPSFITDTKGFLFDMGDQIFSDAILGSDLAFLCSPFKLNVQLALAINYSYRSEFGKKAQCTLSDIVDNVEDAYNDFTKAGWNGWFNTLNNPFNNPYGAYLQSRAELAVRVGSKKKVELKKLDWGGGFFSYEECEDGKITWGGKQGNNSGITVVGGEGKVDNDENNDGKVTTKEAHGKCEVKTPGRTIASSLESQFNVPAEQLGLAESLDAIFNALADQMFKAVIAEAGGLLGASGQSTTGSGSRLGQFVASARSGQLSTRTQGYYDGIGTGPNINPGTGGPTVPGTPPPATKNIALQKSVQVSTARSGFPPTKLVNGNREEINGEEFSGYVSLAEPNPWILINLDVDTKLGRIRIFPRTNPGEESPRNPFVTFTVKLLDRDNNVVWSAPTTYTQDFANEVDIRIPNIAARYVRLDFARIPQGRVELAEIEVYPYAIPFVSLIGSASMSVQRNATFTDPGATAVDFQGDGLPVTVTGTVDTSVAGRYTITYTATDSNQATGTTTRAVSVQ